MQLILMCSYLKKPVQLVTKKLLSLFYRFTLPPFLTLKNFEGLDLGKMDKVSDTRLVTY